VKKGGRATENRARKLGSWCIEMVSSQEEILEYIFKGYTTKDIAQMLDIDIKAVYTIVKEFQREAGEMGVMEAARNNGLEPTVQGLIRLSRDLSSGGLNPEECMKGAALTRLLEDVGVSSSDLKAFVELLYKSSSELGLPVPELVKLMGDFKRFSEEENKDLKELITGLKTLQGEHEKYRNENQSLLSQIEENRLVLEKELEEKKIKRSQLDDYTKTKKALQRNNIDLENLASLEILVDNLKELNCEPESVLKLYRQHQSLSTETKTLESRSDELEKQVADHLKNVVKLQENIRREEEMLNAIHQLKEYSVTPDQVVYLASTINAVGAEHGLAPEKALIKMNEDIKTGYNLKLGFENSLKNLELRWDAMSEQLKLKEEELQALSSVVDARKEALEALHKLEAVGVSDTELKNWDKILEENKYDVVRFRREMEQLGDIKITLDEKNMKIRDLEERERSLEAAKEYLETQIEAEKESLKRLLDELVSMAEILVKEMKQIG